MNESSENIGDADSEDERPTHIVTKSVTITEAMGLDGDKFLILDSEAEAWDILGLLAAGTMIIRRSFDRDGED